MGLTGTRTSHHRGCRRATCLLPLFAGLLQRFQALGLLVEAVPQALAPVALDLRGQGLAQLPPELSWLFATSPTRVPATSCSFTGGSVARAASTLFGAVGRFQQDHEGPPRQPGDFIIIVEAAPRAAALSPCLGHCCYGASAPRLGCLALSKAKGAAPAGSCAAWVCGCRCEDVRLTVKPQPYLDGCPSHGCPSHGQNQRYALNSA